MPRSTVTRSFTGLLLIVVLSPLPSALLAQEPDDLAAISPGIVPIPEAEKVPLSRDGAEPSLRSFVIEGEDRVSINFERPRLELDLDPRSAPGLDWEQTWDLVDPLPPLLARTAMTPSPYTGRPWLQEFAMDEIVVFTPEAPELASWKMTIVDSRGVPARVVEGRGSLPERMTWNGRRDDGTCAWPGLVYSFVLETEDLAGHRRTLSGRGFTLPAFRLAGGDQDVLVLGGSDLASGDLLSEAASWLNQAPGLEAPIIIRATARDRRQGNQLADRMARMLDGQVCGAPDRLVTEVLVVADAPDQGVVEVLMAR
jgi:hypothetical protein